MYMPAATLASVAQNGQIKLFLSRASGANHFTVLGVGPEFRDPAQEGVNVLAANIDMYNYHLNDTFIHTPQNNIGVAPTITADAWHEIQVYEYRDPGASVGYTKVWFDGKLIASSSDVLALGNNGLLGDNDPTLNRGAQFGLVYSQNAFSYPLVIYLDDVAVANGYIDPP
jgi:hypothetical protein